MAVRYTDEEIARLIAERKPMGEDLSSRLSMKEKRGHRERDIEVAGEGGSRFRLILRQSKSNPLNFSIVLGVSPPGSNVLFRLLRYNGKVHRHVNRIEGEKFFDFHVHRATERYQDLGMDADAYAERSDRFSDFDSALECLLADGNFDIPEKAQLPLFRGRKT